MFLAGAEFWQARKREVWLIGKWGGANSSHFAQTPPCTFRSWEPYWVLLSCLLYFLDEPYWAGLVGCRRIALLCAMLPTPHPTTRTGACVQTCAICNQTMQTFSTPSPSGKNGTRKSTATLGSSFAKVSSISELTFARPLKGTMIKCVWQSLTCRSFPYVQWLDNN